MFRFELAQRFSMTSFRNSLIFYPLLLDRKHILRGNADFFTFFSQLSHFFTPETFANVSLGVGTEVFHEFFSQLTHFLPPSPGQEAHSSRKRRFLYIFFRNSVISSH